jgi:hypothetical protein
MQPSTSCSSLFMQHLDKRSNLQMNAKAEGGEAF